jgi:hypothetical protein
MNKTLCLLVLAAALAAATCAPSALTPYTFSATYTPMTSPAEYSPARDCAAYGTLVVGDARSERSKVGVRYLEDGATRHDVTMEGDAEAWLRQAVEHALSSAGIEQSGTSDKRLTVRLEQIVTDEAIYRRAEYDGRVVVDAAVAGGGASWSAKKDGFAENYGYAGSAENYQETLNHALDKALASMVNDPAFVDALCGS